VISSYAPDSSQEPEEIEVYESDMRRCVDACAPTEHLLWGTEANVGYINPTPNQLSYLLRGA